MPPRAPSQENISVLHDAATQSVSTNNKVVDEKQIPKPTGFNTFHWELNLYSFSALALISSLIPETHRVIMHVIFGLIALDAARYYYNRGRMSGVPYTLPMVSLIAMVIRPVRFWAEMANIAMQSDGICTNTLVGNFMVFITDTKLCRQVMTGEGTYGVYAHPNAMWLFGPKNLIYMEEVTHKEFRKILSPALFGNEALTQYAQAQEAVCRRFLDNYAEECKRTGKPIEARVCFRRMAAASSQEAFLKPYLTDEMREHLEQDIMSFTAGFLCFPFPYLNSGLHKAVQAKDRIEATIHKLVPLAREYIAAGNEPRCLLEHWSVAIMERAKELGCDPQDVPFCSDEDIGRTVLDFLFAAQDATNSALAYSLDVLDAHRDVFERMQEEVHSECGKGGEVWTKIRDTGSLPYVCKVANQMIHHKPPVPMIPHISKKDSILGGYKIPKGTVVIPSITYSARTNGASLEFLPEREDADPLFVKCLTFGGGQHKCPGRRYAESLLTVFLAVLADQYDFSRTGPRPGVDEFVYYPTVFPADCNFVLKKVE